MSFDLSRFTILGLHGKIDIDIPIYDNKLILIGVNGLGKTTVINFLYFTLTEQWLKLLEYEFIAINIEINNKSISISKEDIQQKAKHADQQTKLLSRYAMRSPFPLEAIRKLVSHPLYISRSDLGAGGQSRLVKQLSTELDIPSSYVLRMLDDIPKSIQSDLFTSREDPESITQLAEALQAAGQHKVIYLPTYRRIEQDLKAVFPNAQEEELRKLTSQAHRTLDSRNKGHVELVQFGMQDVERRIAEELETIQRRNRHQLSNLSGNYLKDIIRSRADKIDEDLLKIMDDGVVSIVLSRVEENTLSTDDKREVQSAIQRLRKGGIKHPDARDRYLAYFFSRLLDIYLDLSRSEENIKRLVNTCNRYFERKQLVYDDTDYSSKIEELDGSPLDWKVLSSGEKQVASLFTHLYLAPEASQFVLIDEPELSLSVPWQKTLLPDIMQSENCKILIAVTHSPFIYANELDKYVVDLSRLIGYPVH